MPLPIPGMGPGPATTIERREGAARSAENPPRSVSARSEGGGPRPSARHGPRPVGRTVERCHKHPRCGHASNPTLPEGTPAPPLAGGPGAPLSWL